MNGLGLGANSNSYGLSGNGRFVVGETGASPYQSPVTAYRYDRMTGQADVLGALGGGLDQSRAVGASLDGSVVVGFSISDFSSNISRAVRWTEGGIQNLGVTRPGQHHHSEATAVSADGNTVVGFSQGLSGADAFRWTSTTGMTALPSLPGTTFSQALGMSTDASIVVGVATTPQRAVMWRDGGVVNLGVATGFNRSLARSVSDDGAVVVGMMSSGPPSTDTAAIWFGGSGWQPLAAYLSSIGVSIPNDVGLAEATSISRDGRTITGYTTVAGNVQQPWVATIPAPGGGCILFGLSLYTLRRVPRAIVPAR